MLGPAYIQTRAFSYFQGVHGQDPLRVTVTRTEQLEEVVRRSLDAPLLACDTEASGLRWDLGSRICGYVFSALRDDGAVQSYYLPFRHQTGEEQLPEWAAQAAARAILSAKRAPRIWWNRKFDEHMLRREGIRLTDDLDIDAMIEARLYDENTSAGLKARALADLGNLEAHVHEELLGRETVRLAALHGLKKKEYVDRFGFSQIPIHMAGAYACRDGEYTLQLHQHYVRKGVVSWYSQSPRGPQYPGIWHTEQRLARVLCDMEEWGLPINRPYVRWLKEQTLAACEQLERAVWDELGHHRRFNLDSDDELLFFLTQTLRLPLYKQTARGGQLAVDREVLEEFASEAPVLTKILHRREAKKLATTYTDSLLDRADADDVVHGDYQQLGTTTGRASCEKPNLTNIASDSDVRSLAATGKKLEAGGRDPWSVRRAFPVRPGCVRLYFDWSQVELRGLADRTQDLHLLAAYRNHEDLHDQTTRKMFGDHLDKAELKARRKTSKMANFGAAFGLTAMGLSRRAKIPLDEAEEFMRRKDEVYAGIPRYRRWIAEQCRANGGWFNNKFGRTSRIPEICSPDDRVRRSAERRCIASDIQGGAGDLSKDAMVRVDALLRREGLETRIAGWIHDEFQLDVPFREIGHVAPLVKAEMEWAPDYSVPVVVDVAYSATDWSEKRELPGLKAH